MKKLNDYFIEPESSINKKIFQPASYLRRKFNLEKEIKRAELTITACGLYTGFINGQKITNQIFTPGFTFYTKRLQYQKYDVSSLIRKGPNVIGVILGDGWYRGKVGVFSKQYCYGEKTKLASILEINFADGTKEIITTDMNWKATQSGPILKSDWKDGEIYDAQKELTGWQEPDFDDSDWQSVYTSSYNGDLIPSEGEVVLEHERFTPDVLKTPDGATVLDFKQNLFGYVEFSVTGTSGHRVKLFHGETLDENGNFTLKNLVPDGGLIFGKVRVFQQIEYILKDGAQTFKPHFTAQGFRYIKLENWPETVQGENFASIAVYSDLNQTGTFECSNPLVNQLVSNATWSQKSNFMDIPTDCPQRERAGWTGDISCYCRAASYLMDTRKFLAKWLKDLSAQQKEDGSVSSIVPSVGMPAFTYGAAGWADAAIVIPYWLYQIYGDPKILEDQYESMVNWMNFLEKRAKKTHISRWLKRNPHKAYTIDAGFHYGEWLEPGNVMMIDALKGILKPDLEVATGCYGYSTKLISEIASILGKHEDKEKYNALFENIKVGYRFNYTKNGLVESDRQCRYVRPIAYDLLSEEEKRANISILNDMVIKNNYRIGTGFLTTPWVLQMLSNYGYVETAYKLLENTERPGWLYEVRKGATTIWENWNGIDDDGKPTDSFNHYLMGSVTGWLFSHVAGIRPLEPGYKKILIKPLPGGTFTHINCSYDSAVGKITSGWKKDGNKFHLNIEVPTDTEVHMPDGSIHRVAQGAHDFACSLK